MIAMTTSSSISVKPLCLADFDMKLSLSRDVLKLLPLGLQPAEHH